MVIRKLDQENIGTPAEKFGKEKFRTPIDWSRLQKLIWSLRSGKCDLVILYATTEQSMKVGNGQKIKGHRTAGSNRFEY